MTHPAKTASVDEAVSKTLFRAVISGVLLLLILLSCEYTLRANQCTERGGTPGLVELQSVCYSNTMKEPTNA